MVMSNAITSQCRLNLYCWVTLATNYQKMVGLVQYDGLTVMYVNSTVGLNWPMLTC